MQSVYLFTGGAGYVGSHVLRLFCEIGKTCAVIDNLEKGHREAVPPGVAFYEGNIRDPELLKRVFESHPVAGILHFAGYIEVGESVKDPGKYFQNNLANGLPLLAAAAGHHVPWLVFSSSAAVYGEPSEIPIREEAAKRPNNPYGLTKRVYEEMLEYYGAARGLRSISLRYFNAAGAHPSGEIGEDHDPESHLIPLACKAALGKIESLSIHGNDYPTPDGTCIRDYVHIMDLAEAHRIAVAALESGEGTEAYNIGSESGCSVKQVVAAVEKISGKKVPVILGKRRAGDPPVLVASSQKFQQKYSWRPWFESLEKIVESAWNWHETSIMKKS